MMLEPLDSSPFHRWVTWTWRNDPEVRLWSKNPDPISWEDHSRWIQDVVKDPIHWNYLVRSSDHGILGWLRIHLDKDPVMIGRISLIVDPRRRGQGYGVRILHVALGLAMAIPCVSVYGEVHRDNIRSMRAFRRAGFTRHDTGGVFVRWEYRFRRWR